jgi:hypothetical protein
MDIFRSFRKVNLADSPNASFDSLQLRSWYARKQTNAAFLYLIAMLPNYPFNYVP